MEANRMKAYAKRFFSWKTTFILAIILIFAFFLRAQESISGNYLFLIDQGRDMMAVKGIVFDGKPTLIGPYTSLQGVFQGPFWYYLLAFPTFLLGGNPIGAVWLMLILSMLVIAIAYFWVSKNFGVIAGLAAAFLFAFSPQAIAAATFAWNPHPMWILILLYIIFFYTSTHSSKKFYIVSLPLIALMSHFETALAVFIGISSIIYVCVCKRQDFKSKYIWLGMLFSGIFFLPQIFFDLRHNFLMTHSILKILAGSNQGLSVTGEEQGYFARAQSHWSTVFVNFRFAFPEVLARANTSFLLLILLTAGVLLQFKKKISKKEHLQSFLRFLSILVGINWVFMIFLYPFPLRSWFLTGMEVFYILIAAVIIRVYVNKRMVQAVLLLLAIIVLFSAVRKIQFLYFVSQDTGGIAKNKGKLEAIDYVYHDAKTKDFGLLVFTPPVYTYAYDYLIWWRARTTYGFVSSPEKKGTFYLLIEPDSGNSDSYKGWLKTVIKDGKVVKTVSLSSGFIIQKRILE